MHFDWQMLETLRNVGPPPVMGTFTPQLGDIGRDFETDRLGIFTGKEWLMKNWTWEQERLRLQTASRHDILWGRNNTL
jgi:hypothetical protein